MPKYYVRTPDNNYAKFSTIVDTFTEAKSSIHHVDIHAERSCLTVGRSWLQCVQVMVMCHGVEACEATLREVLCDPEVWVKYVRAYAQDESVEPPKYHLNMEIPRPERTHKVLFLTHEAHSFQRMQEIALPPHLRLIRIPAYDSDDQSPEQWQREIMEMINLVEAVYMPYQPYTGPGWDLVSDLWNYAGRIGKKTFGGPEEGLIDLKEYFRIS